MKVEKWRSRWHSRGHSQPIVINRRNRGRNRELGIDISDLHSAVATNKCVMVDYAGERFFVKRIGDDWSPSLRKLAKLDSGLNFVGRSRLVRGEAGGEAGGEANNVKAVSAQATRGE